MTIRAQRTEERERLLCPWCDTVRPFTYERVCMGCGAKVKRLVWTPPPDRELRAVA